MQTEGLVDVLLPKLEGERQRYEATKLVMELQQGSWEDAKKLVQRAPVVIQPGVETARAEELRCRFVSAGINVEVKPFRGGDVSPVFSDQAPHNSLTDKERWLIVALIFGFVAGLLWMYPLSEIAKRIFTLLFAASALTAAFHMEQANKQASPLVKLVKIALHFLGIVAVIPFMGFGLALALWGTLSCFTIIGILWGFPLICIGTVMMAVAIILCGVPASKFYKEVACPYCQTRRGVIPGSVSFKCSGCKQRVLVKNGMGVKIT